MTYNKILAIIVVVLHCCAIVAHAADPTRTEFDARRCLGSSMPYPYPVPEQFVELPDSLRPVMINHVSRHGARYMTSPSRVLTIKRTLLRADSLGTITAAGRRLLSLLETVIDKSGGHWGELDSIGVSEQEGIAERMYMRFPALFKNEARVTAISSYVPRCVMSMYAFTHRLTQLNNKLRVYTSSGPQNNPLLRPFDVDADYKAYRKARPYAQPYAEFCLNTAPVEPARRYLGANYPLSDDNARQWSMTLYGLIAGMEASGFDCNPLDYLTLDEMNRLWACKNLGQYLERSANVLSRVPVDIASDLLADLIVTADNALQSQSSEARVQLRFGHAETMIPLLALMHVPGCYYLTNYYDTVALHWHNFYVAPMACNLQMILLRAQTTGNLYVRFDLNEQPVAVIPGNEAVYVPWNQARDYLIHCLPIDKQL
ncbi:MAG: histidine phosphatase family protein [Muribaculum sp.]|nr:histidine phosphatase family protein [Muribaculaceae bacterium]MCM1080910.1 histidine phosphatase family protein [Muribaculum sp.]